MKLKNILGLAVCLVGTGIFTSCDDFFDLNPKSVDDKHILEHVRGCRCSSNRCLQLVGQ